MRVQQRLLGGVLGLCLRRDAPGGSHQARPMAAGQHLEGEAVAGSGEAGEPLIALEAENRAAAVPG